MDIMQILSLIFIIGLIYLVAAYRLSAIRFTIVLGAGLIAVTAFSGLPMRGLFFLWLIYIAVAIFANANDYRRKNITGPLLKKLKNQLPAISETEQEAIKAGNTWWERELFCGQPDWKALMAMPSPQLSAEEKSFLDNQVDTLCQMINDWQITHEDHDLPPEVWAYIKKEKFFGLIIPKQYGGLQFSAYAHSSVIVKIASRSISAAVNIMVPNSLGPAELLLHYGTEEQKNYYLPRLVTAEEIPCFALTAPHAGSDAGAIPDTGIVTKGMHNGKEVIGMRLTWDKRYITLAPIATVLGLAIHLYDPEHLLGNKEDVGITLCLIPTSHPGVEIGTRHLPMNMAFMNGPTRGTNVFIPLDWIIGGTDNAGKGWSMLMECLSIGRSISLPALATASCNVAFRFTGAYARLRRQFNTAIASFEGIEEALGTIAGYAYTLEAARTFTAGAVDLDVNPSTASAIAKYHMTEMGREVISSAMDIHAGHMIQMGPRNFLSSFYFSTPISITVEGANILTRNLIIFGQGAIRCHPYLLKEIELMSAPQFDIKALDKVLMSHIGFYVSNCIRTICYGLTGGKLIFASSKNSSIKKYERQLTRMSAALAFIADTCLILLGGSLKRRERISARLGDILSQLYLASAVLKYFNSHDPAPGEDDFLRWSLQHALLKAQTAFYELFTNMPQRFLGSILKWCIFPWGYAYHRPSDSLTKKIVTEMLQNNELRQRVTQFCFVSQDKDELTHQLEKALVGAEQNDAIRKKLQRAVNHGDIPLYYSFDDRVKAAVKLDVMTADEARSLIDFEKLRDEIIKVNEFTFDLNKVIA